jgi:hypothetical protein
VTTGPLLPLVRRWAVDWLGGHDPAVCEVILDPQYELVIGDLVFGERSSYVAATLSQIEAFDGLSITVHDVLNAGDRVALWLSEHGASRQHDGAFASWGVIALFEQSSSRITRTFAEEDYRARKRQLGAVPDSVPVPDLDPWNTPVELPNPEAEAVLRSWFERGAPPIPGIVMDDEELVATYEPVMEAASGEFDMLMSAGVRVAWHGRLLGRSLRYDVPCSMAVAGMVTVGTDGDITGRLVTDRLGCERSARRAAS